MERKLRDEFGRVHFHRVAGVVQAGQIGVPAARVYISSAQTIGTGGFGTTVSFTAERYDTADIHDLSTNPDRLVAPVAGVYAVAGWVNFAAHATGVRDIILSASTGVTVARDLRDAISTGTSFQSVSGDVYLEAGEYVTMVVRQTSLGNLDATTCEASMRYVTNG
jgi:hypothetical protein